MLISLVQSVLIARYLGAELQGVFSYIASITSVGAILITFGLHQAYPYFRKAYGKENIYNDYLSLIIVIYGTYILIAVVSMFFPIRSRDLRTIILLIPILGYSKIVAYVCLVERPNIRNLWWNIAGILEVGFLIVLWIFTERGYFWAVSIILFAQIIKSIVYTIILRPHIRIHKGLTSIAWEMTKYGFFPMLALLMATLNYKIDILMLRQYSYITSAMIGQYAIGVQIAERIILIPDTLKGVLVSRLAKGRDEHEVVKVCRISFWASCIICIIILLVGKWAINLLYGVEYKNAYMPLLLSSFGTIAIGYFKLIAQYNVVNKKQILNVFMLSAAIITDIVMNLLLIPLWGINGAAVATGVGNLVCGLVFLIWFSKKTNISVSKMVIPQRSDLLILNRLIRKK